MGRRGGGVDSKVEVHNKALETSSSTAVQNGLDAGNHLDLERVQDRHSSLLSFTPNWFNILNGQVHRIWTMLILVAKTLISINQSA